jgi:hypothetical protein
MILGVMELLAVGGLWKPVLICGTGDKLGSGEF